MSDQLEDSNRELSESVIETLLQGEELLSSLSDEDYTRKLLVGLSRGGW